MKIRILHVDENSGIRQLVKNNLLRDFGRFEISEADNRKNLEKYLAEGDFDIVLSELIFQGLSEVELIELIRDRLGTASLIILTTTDSVEKAVQAMKLGAVDYITKSTDHFQNLGNSIESVLKNEFKMDSVNCKATNSNYSEISHRMLHEKMIDGFAIVDMNGNIIECNQSFQKMVEYSSEELSHLTYFDLTPEKWHDFETRIVHEEVLKKGYSEIYQKEYRKKDGTVFPVELRTILVRNNLGEMKGMWAIVHDVTDRMLAEKVMRESEEKLRLIFDNVLDGISIYDEDPDPNKRKLIECNDRYAAMAGRTREELLRLEYTQPFQKNLHDDSNSIRIHYLSKNQEFRGSFSWIRPDGKDNIIEYIGVPVIWNGKPYSIGIDRDVTNQRKAEEALHKSEARLRSYFDLSTVGIAITSPKRDWVEVNSHLCEMLGYSREELQQKTWPELTYPDDLEADIEYFKRIISGELNTYSMDKRFIRKNGEIFWAHLSVCCVRTENETVDSFVALIFDITERKNAEEALKQSETFIKAVMDNLPLGVAVNSVEPQVKFEYMNDNFPKIYHTTREALIDPDSFWDSVYEDPDFRERIKMRVLDDYTSGDPERMHWEDIPIKRKGSETNYISAKNTMIPGKPLIISTVWDVTQRKMAEEKLRQSEERFRSYIENAPDGIFVAEEKGHIVLVNEAASEITGYNRSELLKMNLLDIITDEDKAKALEQFSKVLEEKGTSAENRFVKKSGEIRIWAIKAVKISDALLLGFFSDITEMRRAEEEIYNLNEELEKRVEEKTNQLKERVTELERFHDATIDREIRMKELRDELELFKKSNHSSS